MRNESLSYAKRKHWEIESNRYFSIAKHKTRLAPRYDTLIIKN